MKCTGLEPSTATDWADEQTVDPEPLKRFFRFVSDVLDDLTQVTESPWASLSPADCTCPSSSILETTSVPLEYRVLCLAGRVQNWFWWHWHDYIFLRGYLSDFSHDSNKTHDKRNLRKKELILAQSIRRDIVHHDRWGSAADIWGLVTLYQLLTARKLDWAVDPQALPPVANSLQQGSTS